MEPATPKTNTNPANGVFSMEFPPNSSNLSPKVLVYTSSGLPKEITVLPSYIQTNRMSAVGQLVMAPIWMSLKLVGNIASSVLNILTLGSLSVNRGRTEDTLKGRAKAMGCSALSILLSPVGVVLDGVNAVGEVIKPNTLLKTHEAAAHVWTGFVLLVGKGPEEPKPN